MSPTMAASPPADRPAPQQRAGFLPHVHAFRGVAIIAVVLAHVRFLADWPEADTAYTHALRSVLEGGTVLFVFIAGLLFQRQARKFRYGDYLRRKVERVILPYLVCSLPALAHSFVFRYGVFADRDELSAPRLAGRLAWSLLTAHHMFVPLWFIPAITVVYLLAPALLALDRHPRWYALVPFLIVAAAFMHLSHLYLSPLHDAANILPAYLLGMLVAHHEGKARVLLHRARHALLAAAAALVLVDVLLGQGGRLASRAPFSTEHGVFDATMLQKVFVTLWLYAQLAHRYAARPSFVDGRSYRALSRLADASFGIFFLHMYVVDFLLAPLRRRWLPELPVSLPLLVAVAALCLALTYALVRGVQRLAGRRSQYLIGA